MAVICNLKSKNVTNESAKSSLSNDYIISVNLLCCASSLCLLKLESIFLALISYYSDFKQQYNHRYIIIH